MNLSPKIEELVKDQGRSYDKALDYIKERYDALTIEEGDFIITIVASPARGIYVTQPEGEIVWQDPLPQDNQHIEIMIQDRLDHRFIPELQVYCKIHDKLDNFIEEKLEKFVWHPFLFHYGDNWSIPQEDAYNITLTIKNPQFKRQNQSLGNRYHRDITVEFFNVHLIPGRVSAQ